MNSFRTDYFQFISNIITYLLLSVFALLFALSLISNARPLGGVHLFLVQSGSMEPTIMTGDVIIVQPQTGYDVKDVITFTDTTGRKTTHRIIDQTVGGEFITRGDANRVQDNSQVRAKDVVGKVILTLPRLGYLVVFSKSLPGLILFIFIPALLIIIEEVRKIVHAKKVPLS